VYEKNFLFYLFLFLDNFLVAQDTINYNPEKLRFGVFIEVPLFTKQLIMNDVVAGIAVSYKKSYLTVGAKMLIVFPGYQTDLEKVKNTEVLILNSSNPYFIHIKKFSNIYFSTVILQTAVWTKLI
jgi:hypothetical protein